MAGQGERFKSHYSPDCAKKPLILFKDEPLFLWALKSIENMSSIRVHLVLCAEDGIEEKVRQYITPKQIDFQIINLPQRTRGPVESAAEALELAGPLEDGPIIFGDCDLTFSSAAWQDFIKKWSPAVDAAVVVFKGHGPYCYVEMDSTHRATRFVEKEEISEWAVHGVYAFKTQQIFQKAQQQFRNSTDEVFFSRLLNFLCSKSALIKGIPVDKSLSLGTPEEIEKSQIIS